MSTPEVDEVVQAGTEQDSVGTNPVPVPSLRTGVPPSFLQSLRLFDPQQTASSYVMTSMELLSPDVAAEVVANLLAPNRRVNQATVARYRGDIDAGLWTFTADPLRFDTNGLLIDGQHRVHALAGAADRQLLMPFSIVLGLPPESIMAMDQGMKRSAGQQLGLSGVKNATSIAAGVRVYLYWESGRLVSRSINTQLSTLHIENWIEQNAALVAHVNDQMGMLRGVSVPPAAAVAASLILAKIDPAAQLEFFTKLSTGGEPQGSPILTLDRRLVKMLRDGGTYKSPEYIGMIFRAWNAWRRGEKLHKIVRPSEMTNFPVPV